MVTLATIEQDLQTALKARDQVLVNTLRGLKTRIQNEQINQGGELSTEQITALIRSEVKRRREAAGAFESGGRTELAEKEQQEAELLNRYLPAQIAEEQIAAKIDELIAQHGWTVKDFGPAMGTLKAEFGQTADGAVLSRILKDKLK